MGIHPGEVAVQRRTGVTKLLGSARARAELPPVAAEFLRRQRMLVVGAADRTGAMRVGLLTGEPGFIQPLGPLAIAVRAEPAQFAELAEFTEPSGEIGTLAIEPWSRRRMRVNGRARRQGELLVIETDQVISNCPKYIQAREITAIVPGTPRHGPSLTGLTPAHQRWIAASDTFFLATHTAGQGADVSHRGGEPGFVRVLGPRLLSWPDYPGNAMYLTLGNLELEPAAGLLFPDWANGDALRLSGRARVDWSGPRRMVTYEIDEVTETTAASPLRWGPAERSPFNPPEP
ncbi:oxidoreductase [Nonomuraea sp. NN258]|uniref:pyridoxamine 5'-phosphate oxidase family protein n=1 Tax=Nonomuraea antri TaxID=2730852 RepID=UPI001567C99A|nr:pyridoxamine 5'-phosphate oxidase family protein [Nonomuraea antri]NRQ38379.1 oxidoreductase [Nonomuraea antri]